MSHRAEKINELLKQELGKILLKEADFENGALITVLKAAVSDDQKTANIYFSVWPDEKTPIIAEKIKKMTGWLQNLLYKKIQLRPTPRITFVLNTEETIGQKIDTLIKKLPL